MSSAVVAASIHSSSHLCQPYLPASTAAAIFFGCAIPSVQASMVYCHHQQHPQKPLHFPLPVRHAIPPRLPGTPSLPHRPLSSLVIAPLASRFVVELSLVIAPSLPRPPLSSLVTSRPPLVVAAPFLHVAPCPPLSSYLRKSKYGQLQMSLQSQCERKNCKGFPLNTIPYAARPVSSLVLIPPRHAARPPSSSCFIMRCGILCCCVASILVTCEQFRRYGRLYMRSSCMPIVPGRSQRDCGSLSGCRSSLGSLGMGGGGAVVLEADIVGGCCLRVCSFWRTGPTESKFGQCSGT